MYLTSLTSFRLIQLHQLQVNSACQSGMMISIIDKNMGPYSSQCLERFMTLALKCCEDETEARPSMLVVVRELENISNMLPPEHDTIPAETSDVSVSSDMSGVLASSSISSLYSRRNLYSSLNEAGSDLISGVIPTIKPRWCLQMEFLSSNKPLLFHTTEFDRFLIVMYTFGLMILWLHKSFLLI